MRYLLAACIACLPFAASAAVVEVPQDRLQEAKIRPRSVSIMKSDGTELSLEERTAAAAVVEKIQATCVSSLTATAGARCLILGVIDAHSRQEFGPNAVVYVAFNDQIIP